MTLLVHGSFSKIGWICGGSVTVIQVLLDLLDLDETLLMPFHTADNSNHKYCQNPSVPSEWFDIIRQLTPTSNMGTVAETFHYQPDILRSQYPQFSIIAVDKKGKLITNKHIDSCVEQSSLARLYDCTNNGYVLLLGCFQANDNIKKSFINDESILNSKTNTYQWNHLEFPDFLAVQDTMLVIQKSVLHCRQMEKVQAHRSQISEKKTNEKLDLDRITKSVISVVSQSKITSDISILHCKKTLAGKKDLSSIGKEPDRRQLLTLADGMREIFKIMTLPQIIVEVAGYRLEKALGIYVVYPTMFDNKAINQNQFFRYEEVSWIALVRAGKEDKSEFVVRGSIGFIFEYVHYFSKRTLKCFLAVIIQSDYDHKKILMKLHWYLGDNRRIGVIDWNETLWMQSNIVPYYYHRIGKIFHRKIRQNLEISIMKDLQESFAVVNGKNVSKQIDLERMMSRIQEGIRVFKVQRRNRAATGEVHGCSQIHQCDVVMRSQKNAEYLSNLKMYFVLLRSFEGKGNVFDDIVSLLPKFKKLGINTLWLSPPQPQTAAGPPMFALNDHGYWPSHHGKIDPVFGGETAFEHLVQEALCQGIEIAVDAVLNHFGYADQVVLNGKEISTSNPNYFVIIPNIQSTYNHHGELNWKIESTSNIAEILQYREELSQYPLFNLPTLRKDNPEVRTYLLDSYKKFVDMGVTTFRIDAAKHMPAEFLVDFSNQLSKYSLMRLGRLSKFIWEVYIVNSQSLSAFIQGTLRSLEYPMNTFFYDFPMREEFRRIQDPNYQFGWLASFVQYREETRQPLDRLIPLVEDHDNGSPIHHPSIAWMIYALTEFYSRNSTFIYHGSEQAGIRLTNRPRINTINESADIGLLVDQLGCCLSPYRNCKESQTFFHVTEKDLLVSEKRLPDGRSMFLGVNKGSVPRIVELSPQDSYDGNQISVQKILATLGSEAELDLSSEKVRLRLSPHSFLTIETHPRPQAVVFGSLKINR